MSDRLKQDFDIFYLELEGKTKHFKDSSQEIETDKMLSRAGKFEQIEKLKAEHEKDLGDLGERLRKEFGTRVHNISNFINGIAPDKRIEGIRGRLKKGENISSEETSRLLLHEMSENKWLLKKSNFQNMLSNADNEQIKKTAQSLNDSQDIERLEWLKELADLRGEGALGGSLGGQIEGIRTANLNDEQRNLQGVSSRIQKGLQLFTYSIEKSKTGEFLDVRSEEILDGD